LDSRDLLKNDRGISHEFRTIRVSNSYQLERRRGFFYFLWIENFG